MESNIDALVIVSRHLLLLRRLCSLGHNLDLLVGMGSELEVPQHLFGLRGFINRRRDTSHQ